MISSSKYIRQLLQEFSTRKPIRTGSLVVTVFGDAVSPHGSAVWLGSLIRILAPFGLNHRQIRTAVFRLVKEERLVARQLGRRSYYGFTEAGRKQYEQAARRIYSAGRRPWDGKWTLALPSLCTQPEREQLRRELSWLGFGTLAPGLLAHPCADRQALDETLQQAGLSDKTLVFSADSDALGNGDILHHIAYNCWNLADIARRYKHFIQRFQPLFRAIASVGKPDLEQSFQLRTLLVHEYRRIHLQDADLPAQLLPPDWVGAAAYELAKNLYHAVRQSSVEYLKENMETPEGRLREPDAGFYSRFDGGA